MVSDSIVEMIKPSSQTPHDLKDYKLSFLDQLAPPIYIPLIFFYQDDHLHRPQHQETLKASLPNVLNHFYIMAGRFSKDNFSCITCNDSGAFFVESKVEKNLLEVIKDSTMEELEKFLPLGPCGSTGVLGANTVLLAVKINLFDCGGMAVAVQMHHNLADANTLVNFMNAWAASARGHEIAFPKLDLANLFPPTSSTNSFAQLTTEKIVTKHVVFDKKEMEKLKGEASKVIENPTRVEAITLFLWRQFSNASRAKGSNKLIGVGHAVNLRPRMDPPLPNHAFGNIYRPLVAVPLPADDNEGDLVGVLRDAIRKVDGDYVKKLQDGGFEHLKSLNNVKGVFSKGEIELLGFSSWSRFPVYEVDFGWGRPVWVSTATFPCKNFIVLMTTSCGEGIEVWVNTLEKDAASLDFYFSN